MTLLTPREETIAELVADQRTNREIAHVLGISIYSVRTYIERIAVKLPGRGKPKQRIAVWWHDRKRKARRALEGPGTEGTRSRARLEAEEGDDDL